MTRFSVVGLCAIAAASCGGESDLPFELADTPRPPPVETLRVESDRIALDSLRLPRSASDRVDLSRRRLLAPVLGQLYFVSRMGQTPPPDAVVLRTAGLEPVRIRSVLLKDDPVSPYGEGAARHFSFTVLPGGDTVYPGAPIEIEVRYLADVTGMRAAVLEIRTDAENLPLIRVKLTGKVIEL